MRPTSPSSAAAPRPATAGPIDTIAALYERGLYLTAYRKARATGVLAASPDDVDAALVAARVLRGAGAPRRGKLLLLRTWRRHRAHPGALVRYGWERLADGPIPVWELLESAGEPPSFDAEAVRDWRLLRALTLALLRDFDAADRAIDGAAALGETPWLWCTRSLIARERDDLAGAIAAARRALELQPWYRPAVECLGDALTRDRRSDDALALYAAAEDHIESYSVALRRAELLQDRGDLAAARRALDRAVALAPAMDASLFRHVAGRLADVAYLLGDVDRSVEWSYASQAPALIAIAERLAGGATGRRVDLGVPLVPQHHNTCAPATLAAIAEYWGRPVDHLTVAEAICYDGTPAHSERRWAVDHGFAAVEFTLTWDAAVALIDAGIPFTLTTTQTAAAHLQAVSGYDARRRTLLVRDPAATSHSEIAADALLSDQAPFGPRAMAIAPADRAPLLASLDLPDAAHYDALFAVDEALVAHDRDRAAALRDELIAAAPDSAPAYRATVAVAAYDGDQLAIARHAAARAARYPDDPRLLVAHVRALEHLAAAADRLAAIDRAATRPGADPWLKVERARLASAVAGDRTATVAQLRGALRWAPVDAGIIGALADALWQRGDRDRAVFLYRFASCLAAADEAAAWRYFVAATQRGSADAALSLLERRARAAADRSGAPARTLGDAYAALHRDRDGIAALERAIAARPDDGGLCLALARQRLATGDAGAADEWVARARGRARERDWIETAADLALWRADFDRALDLWRVAVDRAPLDVAAHAALVDLLRRTRGPRAAVDHLDAVLERFPHHLPLSNLRCELLDEIDDAAARAALRAHVDRHPHDAAARERLAVSLARCGDAAEAASQLDAARAVDGQSARFLVAAAQVALATGDRTAAVDALRAAVRDAPNDTRAAELLLSLAADDRELREELMRYWEELAAAPAGDGLLLYQRVAHRVEPPGELSARLDAARARHPHSWHAWSAAIRQRLASGDARDALALAERAADRFPLVPAAWVDRAAAHAAVGDAAARIAALERAVALNPHWPTGLQDLSDAYVDAGDLARARGVLERAVQIDPMTASLHGYLADVLMRLGDRAGAIARIQRALQIEPSYGWAWNRLAAWTDSPRDAIAFAERLCAEQGERGRVWLALADLLRDASPDERLALIDTAIERDPTLLDAYDARSELLAQQHRWDEALAACRPPLWGDRPPAPLRGRAAWILYQRGRRRAAYDAMLAVVAATAGYAWGVDRLCDWAAALPDDEAVDLLRRTVDAAPWSEDARIRLGQALAAAGDLDAAAAELERALAAAPDSPAARQLAFDVAVARDRLDEAGALLPPDDRADAFDRARRVELAVRRGRRDEAVDAYRALCADAGDAPWPVRHATALLRDAGLDRAAEQALVAALADPPPAGDDVVAVVYGELLAERSCVRAVRALARLVAPAPRAGAALAAYLERLADSGRRIAVWLSGWLCRARAAAHTVPWSALGYALLRVGPRRAAAAWLADWRDRVDAAPFMLQNVATALRRLGRFAEARAATERALALPADRSLAFHQLSLAGDLALDGDVDAARALWLAARAHTHSAADRQRAAFVEALLAADGERGGAYLDGVGDRLGDWAAAYPPHARAPAVQADYLRAVHALARRLPRWRRPAFRRRAGA
ncbi:MAG: hypothetical protein D6689_10215 [Deltaproteobacteria bacterium]|nr:MAG: hypothetical protein D6689_10215 [Deltaproteobacteria bacterium]